MKDYAFKPIGEQQASEIAMRRDKRFSILKTLGMLIATAVISFLSCCYLHPSPVTGTDDNDIQEVLQTHVIQKIKPLDTTLRNKLVCDGIEDLDNAKSLPSKLRDGVCARVAFSGGSIVGYYTIAKPRYALVKVDSLGKTMVMPYQGSKS